MTSICGWGSNSFGQVGADPEGDPEDDAILIPKIVNFFNGHTARILGVACGWNHTVFWMSNGLVYSTGLNDNGQLGYADRDTCHPEWIKSLETQNIVNTSCGELHTVVINDNGLIYSFGNNQKGQLGIGASELVKSSIPRLVKGIPKHVMIVKVSCGKNHTLALSSAGDVYSWGANEHGQCGVSVKSVQTVLPQRLDFFIGLPIYKVAAGGNHSIALTISGTVFAWGKNGYGQLGLGDDIDRPLPTKVKMLCRKSICHVACGEEHTIALTSSGGVFTFGAGSSGQLGHNSFNDEYNPKMVTELMGTVITQVACGRKHSLAYVSRTGRLYTFGLGAAGQLGVNSLIKHNTPVLSEGNWAVDRRVNDDEFLKYINFNNMSYFEEDYLATITYLLKGDLNHDNTDSQVCVQEIFAGGLYSFATLIDLQSGIPTVPTVHCMTKQGNLIFLTQAMVEKMIVENAAVDVSMEILSRVFSNIACLNGSFLKKIEHEKTSMKNHGIHLMAVRNSCAVLNNVEKFKKVIVHCVKEYLIPSLSSMLHEAEACRVLLIIPELPFFNEMEEMWHVIIPFANSFHGLPEEAQRIIINWWSTLPATFFERHITPYKNCIKALLNQKLPETPNAMIFALHEALKSCIQILEKLDQINNELDSIVPYTTFYIEGLMEKINVKADYMNWIQQPTAFSFCKYPFAFNVKVKASLLQIDAERQMHDAVKEAHMSNIASLVHGNLQVPNHPLLVLHIRREHIVRDTLSEILMHPPHEMKKPLKIKFSDEDGEDAGGVRKEFFLLLMKEILDPKYGMFDFYEDTRVIWFKSQSFEETDMFMLIGVICGLAIYNSTIIDLPFPVCLYKKLLNKKINLDDLRGLQPDVARSLQELLDYQDDDLEEVFALNFQVTEHSFGETKTIDLITDGGNIPVTEENKEDYVNHYINYKLNLSVEKEFRAFSRGFHRVCGGSVLNLFHPLELMEFVVGSQDYDFAELEEAATYQSEYYRNHPVIQRFWEVFHGFSTEMKKKFLQFLTGSDKVAIFGMKTMKFVIQPVGSSEDHLPVAHTCFNLLDLPRYHNVDVLRQKLCQAIENSQGFGLV